MQILKPRGNYLEQKAKYNRNTCIVVFVIGIALLAYAWTQVNYGLIYLSIFIFSFGGYFLKRWQNYTSGASAENLVTQVLSELGNEYLLINDIKLPESYGNIDHIVIGPTGIFVIETKNYGGKIVCHGDKWERHYDGGLKVSARGNLYWKDDKDYQIGSPSKQVKRNAVKIKTLIEESGTFGTRLKIWVEGLVVLTNPKADLQISDPTVPVLKINELQEYITTKQSRIKFSSKELETIAQTIMSQ